MVITSTKIASWKGILKSMRDILLMAHDKDTAAAIDNAIDVMVENYKHLELDEMDEDWHEQTKELRNG